MTAAHAYDAYLILLDAITRANSTDPIAIRDAIANTKNFVGATGTISLDKNGDAVKQVIVKTVTNGNFVFKGIVRAE